MATSLLSTWILPGALGVAVVGQAVYTAQLRDEVRALSEAVATQRSEKPAPTAAVPTADRPARPLEVILRPTADTGPDPEELAAGVHAAVADEIERREEVKKDRKATRKAETYSELRELVQDHLGLAAADADHLESVLTRAGETRQQIRNSEKDGELSEEEATASLSALLASTREEMAKILGDDWPQEMGQARSRMIEARRKLREQRGGGGVFWFMPPEED